MATPSQPSVYTTDHSASVLRTHSWRTGANSAGYLLPHLRSDMKILDIGCGPGSITIDLARLVPRGHVTGVEYVPDPLEEARALAAAKGVTNITFEIGDIHSLRFEDDTFDVVHAHQVLQHIADPVKALQEMRRVTKVGGLVACRVGIRDLVSSIGEARHMAQPDNENGRFKGGQPPSRQSHSRLGGKSWVHQ